MSAPLLAVQHLTKFFGVTPVLRGISFDIARGECVALVGESGSGKSTTARLLAGLLPATSGTVQLDGKPVLRGGHAPLAYRRRVQMIFQDPFASLNPVHTVGYHLARPLLRHRLVDRAGLTVRIHALLESVGLAPAAELATRYPHQLSGGMRQRVAIARALAVEPSLLLADEPTSMLDASIRVGILNLLRDLKDQRGISILFITHDLASARYLSDRTLVMLAGKVVESGPSEQIMSAPQHAYTQKLINACA